MKILCASILLLSSVSFAETYTWHGEGEQTLPAGGAWGVAENWRVGSERATQIPSVTDTAQFVGAQSPTVTFDTDYTVSSVTIPNNDANKPKVTFNLGGHTLSVTNALRIQKTWNRALGFVLTNGTVTTRDVSCGITAANEWDWGAGLLSVQGANTELYITNRLDVIGSYATLDVANGAKVNCGILQASTGQSGGKATISGVGSQLTVRSDFRLRDRFALTVSDGGKVLASQTSGRVMIGNIRSGGRDACMTVDGGTFEVSSTDVTVGDVDSGSVRSNALVLTHGAVMTMAKKLVLGTGHLGGQLWNNMLLVRDGSTVTGSATSEIWAHGINRDKVYYSRENLIEIDDSTVSVMRLKVGNVGPKPTSSNNVLKVCGPRAKIALSGTATDAFTLRMGSELHMTIPEGGFNATPIQALNGGATIVDDLENGAKKVGFFFDAGAYSRKHKGQPVTLIECGLDSAESLQRLADNVTYVNTPENLRGTLEVVDGKKLVYNPPPAPGLILLFK